MPALSEGQWLVPAYLQDSGGGVLASGLYVEPSGSRSLSAPRVLKHEVYFFDADHGYGWDPTNGVLWTTSDGCDHWQAVRDATLINGCRTGVRGRPTL